MKIPNTKRRHPALLKIEGWYDVNGKQVKISCRFRDILRCASFPQPENPYLKPLEYGKCYKWRSKVEHPIHFNSCFADGLIRSVQPLRRIRSVDNCAIIYLPDKHGNFQARTFLWVRTEITGYDENNQPQVEDIYEIDKVYGNGLDPNAILELFKKTGLTCRYNPNDTYLGE